MKKYILAVVTLCSLISCKENSSNKQEVIKSENVETKTKDCNCSEISGLDYSKGITRKGETSLYTGVCVEKDQYDSIVKSIEIKNGWHVRELLRQKVNNEYVTIQDMNFENGEYSNGWMISIEKISSGDVLDDGMLDVENYTEYKNGKVYNKWKINAYKVEGYYVQVSKTYIKGKYISKFDDTEIKEMTKPKCMPDSEYNSLLDEIQWERNNISPEEYFKILDCLKRELPKFNYWKV